jgi:hypothetical protein
MDSRFIVLAHNTNTGKTGTVSRTNNPTAARADADAVAKDHVQVEVIDTWTNGNPTVYRA